MIRGEGLNKKFGSFQAIDGLNIHVGKGNVYGLVGPNGAGKTTLIKMLNGIFRPDSGSISIDGQAVWENEKLKKRMIYVSDDLYYFSMATIKDLAQFYAGIYPHWNSRRYERLKEAFPIEEKRRLIRLSKGMQKQVAFWLGLCTMPEIMILDEPVDGLDPVMRRQVWSLMLQDVAEREMTVLVSSHNLRELEDVCDHVGILNQGRMLLEKNLDEVKANIYKIQVAFAGDAEEAVQAISSKFQVLNKEVFGSVWRLIIKGRQAQVVEAISEHQPLLLDWLPLTLEEVFIYELGGEGYDVANIVL
ncbi:MAG: ABC transporter ATP-binding protein [Clostridiales bacterium]